MCKRREASSRGQWPTSPGLTSSQEWGSTLGYRNGYRCNSQKSSPPPITSIDILPTGGALARILVVDDDPEVQQLLDYVLRREGHETLAASSGEQALQIVQVDAPDLVILDVMLPGIDGFSVCERLRLERSMPVLMLTGRVEEHDKIRGLDTGADDYLTKPFSPGELLARVRALIRRITPDAAPPARPFQVGSLEIDLSRGHLKLAGRDVHVSRSEAAIVACLAAHVGEPVSARRLAKQALNYECDEAQARSILKVRISRLRQKLGDDSQHPRILLNVRGVGYELRPPEMVPARG
jgi:DNA-binding response OmpR family regulator